MKIAWPIFSLLSLLALAAALAWLEHRIRAGPSGSAPAVRALAEGAQLARMDSGGVFQRAEMTAIRLLADDAALMDSPRVWAKTAERNLYFRADSGRIPPDRQTMILEGHAEFSQDIPQAKVTAQEIIHDLKSGAISASGGIEFERPEARASAQNLQWTPDGNFKFSGGVRATLLTP